MSMFRWLAPVFKQAARRWSENDFRLLADRLSPFVSYGGVFLDLGGGTGDLGAGVARSLAAGVIVADQERQMLLRVSGDPLVSVRLARAEALPFPDSSFDAVLCSDAFHHFRDQNAAAFEMARVVRPGGGVLLLEFSPAGWGRFVIVLEKLMREPAAFMTPAGLQDFLAARGIRGTTKPERGISYSFLGSLVRPHDDVVDEPRAPEPDRHCCERSAGHGLDGR